MNQSPNATDTGSPRLLRKLNSALRSHLMLANFRGQFPLAEYPLKFILRFLRRALSNWRERHRHPFNFAIHMIGIPMAVAGVVLLFFTDWYWGVGAFVLGYLLQWIGHLVEGNDMGEWAGIKRLLGWPYVAIAPQYLKRVESSAKL